MSQTKAFRKEDIQAAIRQDTDKNSPLVLEHTGKWVAEGKYQYRQIVLKETSTGAFYCYNHGRSGSPFTEYTYSLEWEPDMIKLYMVVKATKIIEVWE